MDNADNEYFKLVDNVLTNGRKQEERTGVGTLSVFGAQSRYNLQEGFPLLTTKKVFFKGIIHELVWFLSGSTNIKYLVDNNVHIWDSNAFDKYRRQDFNIYSLGTQGPIDERLNFKTQEEYIQAIQKNVDSSLGELGQGTYGWAWRSFGSQNFDIKNGYCDDSTHDWLGDGVDQIKNVIQTLKQNPQSRRHIVTAWHPEFVDSCALPPCHCLFQFHTERLTVNERLRLFYNKKKYEWATPINDDFESFIKRLHPLGTEENPDYGFYFNGEIPEYRLNVQLYQRSADLFLGVPFNIASYALLLEMVAQVTNMVPGDFVHTFGDLHIYRNHIEQIKEQRSRIPKENIPTVSLNRQIMDLFAFKYDDIKLVGYESHPVIKAEMAI